MNDRNKVVVIVVVVALAVAAAIYGFNRFLSMGNLDQGQVEYTPGVPPWQEKDPNKRAPAGGQPTIDNRPQ